MKSYSGKKSRLCLSVAASIIVIAGVLLLAFAGPDRKGSEDAAGQTIAAPITGAPLRILPLGDSITQADSGHRGYRYSLWIKLIDAGITFDFVGSMNSNHGSNPEWLDHEGRSFDADHEGHWGWRADEILSGISGLGKRTLSKWLKTYTPDVVLMHLGTNDILLGQSNESTVDELRQIIDVLRADNRNVVILLATLIPTENEVANTLLASFNEKIEQLAMETSTKSSPVIVVDQYKGFNGNADTYDGLHPNDSGEEKMAAKWFRALQDILDKGLVSQDKR